MGSDRGSSVGRDVIFAMVFNYVSSTGIVSANKFVMRDCGFHFATTLTFFHFIVTTLGLMLFALLGIFDAKVLDARKSGRLAAAGMGFVIFSNLSLQHNSVGFYQVMKHMTVAAVVAIEALVFKKFLERALWFPLLMIIVGVSLTGATDFQLNFLGTVYAIINIFCTAFYQIWCNDLQRYHSNDFCIPCIAESFLITFLSVVDPWTQILSSSSCTRRQFRLFSSFLLSLC